eukprot:GHVU01162347.1.p1 GENE.GHVU01162347.1~~GHVU01162347.1.p1  ORF type:complete len:144 (+),score=4.01 GHVU01162347.1:241-672(+)
MIEFSALSIFKIEAFGPQNALTEFIVVLPSPVHFLTLRRYHSHSFPTGAATGSLPSVSRYNIFLPSRSNILLYRQAYIVIIPQHKPGSHFRYLLTDNHGTDYHFSHHLERIKQDLQGKLTPVPVNQFELLKFIEYDYDGEKKT